MSAYANSRSQLRALPTLRKGNAPSGSAAVELAVIDGLITQLADRVAAMVVEQLSGTDERANEWLDSRHAAEYLGVHRDTLRKLASERSIPSDQDGPNCKLYFRRSDLDAWRHGGGRPRHLAAAVRQAA
jgi:excisionase family DNA binding protein